MSRKKKRLTNLLPRFIGSVDQKAIAGITRSLILGGAEASVLTPIDTSTLINSQYREVLRDGKKLIGRFGYSAAYALPVHDPDNPQNFNRPTATKEFLRVGFERAEPNIRAVITGAIKA